jgi:hypothetical protein
MLLFAYIYLYGNVINALVYSVNHDSSYIYPIQVYYTHDYNVINFMDVENFSDFL